ncbi:unnamed protein product, partial [Caenorhabditis brenneri]
KSMRNTSINLMMAAVALSDMYSQFFVIEQKIKSYYENLEIDKCYTGTSYFDVASDILLKTGREFSRRSSTWLSFCIALIRTLVIRNPMNPTFEQLSKPKAGIIFILVICLIDLVISIIGHFQYEILSERIRIDCGPSTKDIKRVTSYRLDFSLFFMDNDEKFLKMYTDFDAIVSKFIPCILFPIATIFLIFELRKAEVRRQKLASSNSNSNSGKTTKLVLCLTITFFIAEFPLALIYALRPYFDDAYGILLYCYYGDYLFTTILSITTASHMIICLFMSSQYREATKSVATCGWSSRRNNNTVTVRTSVMSINDNEGATIHTLS